MKVYLSDIEYTSHMLLKNLGIPDTDEKIITESIAYAHVHGKPTHGLGRMPIYARKIKENLMSAVTNWTIKSTCNAVAVTDCKNGFGQVAAYHGMNLAIEKAENYGVGLVTVKHSNNFGAAGFYSQLAASSNMVGIVLANAAPAISIGGTALLGTNPISIAFPAGENDFNLDMAMSNAARGKIRLALQNGENIPIGLAVDAGGNDTTDPARALEGAMLPIGGIKGAGLAMVVDLLAGLISGAAFAGDVKNLNHPTEESNCGHMLIAIDIKHFMSIEEYKSRMEYFVSRVHENGAMLPGEHGRLTAAENDFYEISDKQAESINHLLSEMGMEHRLVNR